jgi:lysozyme
MKYTITRDTLEFIAQFEGFSSRVYKDPVGIPTIGYGTTRYPNGTKVSLGDPQISKDTALSYMEHHIRTQFLTWVEVNVPGLNANQLTAIISLIYNIGLANFKSSSVYLFIKRKVGCAEIERAFKMWNRSKGKVLAGLTRRRNAEANLFCG